MADEIATRIVARLIAGGWLAGPARCCGGWLRYHVHKADPVRARRRYQRAVAQRRVNAGVCDEGTGFLSGSNLPVDKAAADEYLNRLAGAAKANGDPRTVAQLRADAYLDLLTGIAFRAQPGCDPVSIAADAAERADWAATRGPLHGITTGSNTPRTSNYVTSATAPTNGKPSTAAATPCPPTTPASLPSTNPTHRRK